MNGDFEHGRAFFQGLGGQTERRPAVASAAASTLHDTWCPLPRHPAPHLVSLVTQQCPNVS
eukprot:1161307-Pelagomonas_calceolata.AAC.4